MDERTPLLATERPPPLPPKPPSPTALFPTAPTLPPERPHIHLSPPQLDAKTLSLPALAHAAAAIQAGHLPSTEQLLALSDLVLNSPLLDDDSDDGRSASGTVWEPRYGEGRLGTGRLTREGERVRLAAREGVWSLRELLEGRNPVVKRQKVGGDGVELVGETDEGQAGNGWQEFVWRCRESKVDVHFPTAHLPHPDQQETAALRSSMLSLLQLFLTSSDLRSLLADAVLLLRDTVDVTIETVEKRNHLISEGASEALRTLVDGVAEMAVDQVGAPEKKREPSGGLAEVVEDEEVGQQAAPVEEKPEPGLSYAAMAARAAASEKTPGAVEVDVAVEVVSSPSSGSAPPKDPPEVEIKLNGEAMPVEEEQYDEEIVDEKEPDVADPPEEVPQVPQKSPEQVKDAFVDRFKEILIRLQATPSYQRSVQTLLSLLRSYLSTALKEAKPSAAVHAAPVAVSPGSDGPLTPPETPPYPGALNAEEDEEEDEEVGDPTELLIPLLEPFTGGPGSLVPLRHALDALLSHLSPSTSSEPALPNRLQELARSLDSLVSKALLVPGWVGSNESHRALSQVYDTASTLGADAPALQRDFSRVLELSLDALKCVADDPLLARALLATEELGLALAKWAEAAGETTVRAVGGEGVGAVWGDVVEWVVPRVLGVLREVPLPRIEVATPTVSLAIDPPSLLSTSFIPSSLSIRTSTALTYLPVAGSSSLALPPSSSAPASDDLAAAPPSARTSYAASTAIDVQGLRLEVNDVGYFARYHTGLPCVGDITESGLLDLHFGSHPEGGLALSLATTTSSAPSSNRTLFRVDKSSTAAKLTHFDLKPHHSSHPLLMWMFRPVIRKAVQKVVEYEVRHKLLIDGAEWAGKKGYEVREAKQRRDLDDEARGMRTGKKARDEGKTAEVWKWVAAVWEVVTGKQERDPLAEAHEDADRSEFDSDNEDGKTDDGEDEHGGIGYSLHLNRHGVAVDLERGPSPSPSSADEPEPVATIGLGTAGVVLPPSSAPIPTSDRRPAKKGLVRAAREEVNHEVEEGRRAAREVMETVGEAGEVRDEYSAWVREEEHENVYRSGRRGWRSEAFDLQP